MIKLISSTEAFTHKVVLCSSHSFTNGLMESTPLVKTELWGHLRVMNVSLCLDDDAW